MDVVSEYECSRPLRLAVFGAKGVGKTNIALQYLSEHVAETQPTTIEDTFRKNVSIAINDKKTLELFLNKWKERQVSTSQEQKVSSEQKRKRSSQQRSSESTFVPASTCLKFAVEITDTAGFVPNEKVNPGARSSLSRMIAKHKRKPQRSGSKRYSSESTAALMSQARSRSTSSVANMTLAARRDSCLGKCDGLILVFSVLEPDSLKMVQDIRDRFVQLHASKSVSKSKSSRLKRTCVCRCCCSADDSSADTDYNVPPTFVIGTHTDERSKRVASEGSSRLYNVNFSRDRTILNARTRETQKRSSAESAVLFPQDVYEVINGWTECAGFAEVTSRDHNLVQQIFELLALSSVLSSPLKDWTEK